MLQNIMDDRKKVYFAYNTYMFSKKRGETRHPLWFGNNDAEQCPLGGKKLWMEVNVNQVLWYFFVCSIMSTWE